MVPQPPNDDTSRGRVWLDRALLLLAVGAYYGWCLDRGWIPHDEGYLGRAAVNILSGEVPHLHFQEIYSGGLSYLHAAAMALLGERILSMRILLWAASLGFVGICHAIAGRLGGRLRALAVAALCAAWCTPLYFASMPSWYNLFSAGLAAGLLLLYSERRRPGTLYLVGAAAGLSTLFKWTPGAFLVGALTLALMVLPAREPPPAPERGATALRWGVASAAVLCLLGLWATEKGPNTLAYGMLPGVVVAVAVAAYAPPVASRTLLGRLGRLWLGFVLPPLAFALPYAAAGELKTLVYAVLVAPLVRLEGAAMPFPPLWKLAVVAVPLALLCWRGRHHRGRWIALLALGAVLGSLGPYQGVYGFGFATLRPLVLGAALMLAWRMRRGEASPAMVALTAVMAFHALIQFPFAHIFYFGYVAPLVVLAFAALIPRRAVAAPMVWAFYLFFALFVLHRDSIRSVEQGFVPREDTTRLELPRAGIRVTPGWARVMSRLTQEVSRHAPPGSPVYAYGDCPEVAFLAERPNPVPEAFDSLAADAGDPEERAWRVLSTLAEQDVRTAVVCRGARFTTLDPRFIAALSTMFPHQREVEAYLVLWRDPADSP